MVPKIAALTVFIRFLYVPFLNLIDQWQMIIVFLSIASMIFGAIAAIGQTNIKRLVAYSSIGHIGYTLAGLASGSNDLMVFYMGLELQSLALYVLATFNRDQLKSSEAGLKYFVLSALSSGLLLYGCSLIYGFSGSTNFDVIANQLTSCLLYTSPSPRDGW